MSTGWIWAAYLVTYGLVAAYVGWLVVRLRRHRRPET